MKCTVEIDIDLPRDRVIELFDSTGHGICHDSAGQVRYIDAVT